MADLLIISKCIWIWISIYFRTVTTQKFIGDIDCYYALPRGCEKECTATCSNSCENVRRDIWGTAFYTYDSPICRSAVHDLRISTWNTSARTVTFQYVYDIKSYVGSIRQNIKTLKYGKLKNSNNGCYYFKSPRITEEILDVISLHHNYFYNYGESNVQQCRIATNALNREITFKLYHREYPLYGERHKAQRNESYFYYQMSWEKVGEESGFWCLPNKSMLSGVLSQAMRKDAHYLPNVFTITVSIKDDVVIRMNPTRTSSSRLWRKNEDEIDFNDNRFSSKGNYMNITDVRIGDSGFYSLYNYNLAYRGTSRLIVRVCRKDKYGSLCQHKCPVCLNGGICHDLTGDCLCPPGFNGTYCGNACGAGFFGRDCSQQCFDANGNATKCTEILFCLPDPYGCSCISGYNTVFCNKKLRCARTYANFTHQNGRISTNACDPGRYGAGCTQSCSNHHCKNLKGCDPSTGTCPFGCADGWHGNSCNLSYPRFRDSPVINEVTPYSIEVIFRKWKADYDIGYGKPDYYVIEYKNDTLLNSEWTEHEQMKDNETEENVKYTSTITNLAPDTLYSIRVIIVDESGEKQLSNVPIIIQGTSCGVPQQPPVNISVDGSASREITVKWKLPPPESWQCKEIWVSMYSNSSFESITRDDLNTDVYTIRTSPYTEWKIWLRVVNKDNLYSKWSEEKTVTSAQDAPSEVTSLSAANVNPFRVLVKWDKPKEENGIITKYIVRYQQKKWLHRCNIIDTSFIKKEILNISEMETDIEVLPSSEYSIDVSAVTTKEGECSQKTIETEESVPGGPPLDLRTVATYKNFVNLIWYPPNCTLYNGRIKGYKCVVYAQDPWDDKERSENLGVVHAAIIEDLFPFTRYTALVYAGTVVGFSNISAEVNFTTRSEKPPAPSSLTVYHSAPSILSLSWKPPYPPKGELDRYIIIYRCRENQCNEITNTVYPNETVCDDKVRMESHCYILTKLIANQKYDIEIYAFNKHINEKGDTATVEGETKESVPDPPSKAYLENVTEYSFIINWEVPLISNGNISAYRINITAIDSYNTEIIGTNQTTVNDPDTRYYLFSNLYPATWYNATIEASTSAGYGKPLIGQFSTKQSVPVIEIEPELGEVTDTSVKIIIKPISFNKGPISCYFVLVKTWNNRRKRETPTIKVITYNESLEQGLDYYMAAKFYPEDIGEGINFTIGDGKCYKKFCNPPLRTGKNYNIGIVVSSNYSGQERVGYKYISRSIKVKSPEPVAEKSSVLGIVIGILVALIVLTVIVIILYRNPNLYKKMQGKNGLKIKALMKEETLVIVAKDNGDGEPELEKISQPQKSSIPVSQLEQFVTNALRNGDIRKQFVALGKEQLYSWDEAKRPENKIKNRYGNLLPYDHSRVLLMKLPNDTYSNYINANYIDGYKVPKRYIATQGPKPLTVNDFWRMIWQENVCKIVMSTNLVENGKTKCEKYWPENYEKYGEIKITVTDTEVYADYVIRTFNIAKENEIRNIKHFHFTTWPDHGVPMYAITVVNFIQKVRGYNPNNEGPILIHCSAGVGRTGTLILIDSMLDMAEAEKQVDLISHLYVMRQQRFNMVETLDQYSFVYQALIDALCGEKTAILCSDYVPALNKLKEVDPTSGLTKFHVQFEKLSKLCPPLKVTDCRTASEPSNQGKNRNADILTPDRSRPILKVAQDSSQSSYINAVYVNGYKQKDAFLVTQIPLPETVSDFWRMAFAAKTSTIILLNELEPADETSAPYWPTTKEIYENIEVAFIATETEGDIIIRTFELRDLSLKDNPPKLIKQFHLIGWLSSEMLPSSADLLLNLIEKVERWEQHSSTSTVIVQCLNGVRACGLYCTSVFVCDKIKSEQEIDVFLAVRSIRANRPQFVETVEQYIYCHQIALTFLDSFETYANFQ